LPINTAEPSGFVNLKKPGKEGNPGKCAGVCEGGLKLFNEF